MDATSSKRRKLSHPPPDPDERGSRSPSKSRDERPPTPNRASYMSPTKASLARFNPDLLQRPRSAGARSPERSLNLQNPVASPRRLNPIPLRPATPTRPMERPAGSPVRAGGVSPTRRTQSIGGGLAMPARRQSRSPEKLSAPTAIMGARGEGGAGGGGREVRPSKTTQQMGAPAVGSKSATEDLLSKISPAQTKAQRGQQYRGKNPPRTEPKEPELPPTPEELGLQPQPERPQGLLSSSPSHRAAQRRAAAKSSPLKPRGVTAVQSQGGGESRGPVPRRIQDAAVVLQQEQDDADDPERRKQRELLAQLSNQLQAIQSDIQVLEQAVERNREAGPGTELGEEEARRLLAILTSTNPSHKSLPPPPKPPTLADRLSLFLPFTKLHTSREPAPEPPPPPTPSHQPIELAGPLPYLHAFTPFQINAIDNVLLNSGTTAPLLVQQDLSMTSPEDVLSLELRLVTDTVSETVDSFSLTSISPWAREELGEWAMEQALSGDVNSIGWAAGRYWELACIRAKCWARCKASFPGLVAGEAGANGLDGREEQRRSKGQAKRKKRRKGPSLDGGRDFDGENGARTAPSRRAIYADIGRQSLLLASGGVSLLVAWRIGLDWTGETESHISASTSFPTSWRKADKRRSLGMVERAFDHLVKERGVCEAVRIVANLLFPD